MPRQSSHLKIKSSVFCLFLRVGKDPFGDSGLDLILNLLHESCSTGSGLAMRVPWKCQAWSHSIFSLSGFLAKYFLISDLLTRSFRSQFGSTVRWPLSISITVIILFGDDMTLLYQVLLINTWSWVVPKTSGVLVKWFDWQCHHLMVKTS